MLFNKETDKTQPSCTNHGKEKKINNCTTPQKQQQQKKEKIWYHNSIHPNSQSWKKNGEIIYWHQIPNKLYLIASAYIHRTQDKER